MGVKRGVISTALSTLASIAATEAKKNGKFVIPGVVAIKTRQKKATKAGKREIFGKMVMGRRSRPRPSSRPSPRRPSRTSSEGLRVCGEPREEAPRVLLHFLLLLLVHPPSEEHSCHFVQVGRRVRGHAWPSPVPGRSARAITCTPRM